MTETDLTSAGRRSPQRARAAVRFGSKAEISGGVEVTSAGIVAIGIVISGILLSTAVLVRAAKH